MKTWRRWWNLFVIQVFLNFLFIFLLLFDGWARRNVSPQTNGRRYGNDVCLSRVTRATLFGRLGVDLLSGYLRFSLINQRWKNRLRESGEKPKWKKKNFPFSARYKNWTSHSSLLHNDAREIRNRNGQPLLYPTGSSSMDILGWPRTEKEGDTTCSPFFMVAFETKQIQIILLEPAAPGSLFLSPFPILSSPLISRFKMFFFSFLSSWIRPWYKRKYLWLHLCMRKNTTRP